VAEYNGGQHTAFVFRLFVCPSPSATRRGTRQQDRHRTSGAAPHKAPINVGQPTDGDESPTRPGVQLTSEPTRGKPVHPPRAPGSTRTTVIPTHATHQRTSASQGAQIGELEGQRQPHQTGPTPSATTNDGPQPRPPPDPPATSPSGVGIVLGGRREGTARAADGRGNALRAGMAEAASPARDHGKSSRRTAVTDPNPPDPAGHVALRGRHCARRKRGRTGEGTNGRGDELHQRITTHRRRPTCKQHARSTGRCSYMYR
jgi:hypothetical protein